MKAFATIPCAPLFVAACTVVTPSTHADFLAYDNARFQTAGVAAGRWAQSGNAWMGQSLTLTSSTPSLSITGIDVPVYVEGPSNGPAGGAWRLRVRIYDSYAPSGAPVFSNLVSEQFVVATTGGLSQGFVYGLNSPTPNTPFWQFATPVTVSALGPIGISYIFETFNGTQWASSTSLQTVAFANNSGPLVGSSAMPGGNGYYRRDPSTLPSMPGNFESSEQLQITSGGPWTFNGLDLRVWTAVPTPGTFALIACGGLAIARRRRN